MTYGFTHVDPFEDTESERQWGPGVQRLLRFTHVDPFEDTERSSSALHCSAPLEFHPRRSVRGY